MAAAAVIATGHTNQSPPCSSALDFKDRSNQPSPYETDSRDDCKHQPCIDATLPRAFAVAYRMVDESHALSVARAAALVERVHA